MSIVMTPELHQLGEAAARSSAAVLDTPRAEPSRLRSDVAPRTAHGPRKVGVIYNPASAANQGKSPIRAVGVPCGQPTTRDELVDVLREFARKEVDIVTASGGDGTIREILTAIPAAYGSRQPAVAILAAGRTDLIAGEVGSSGRRDELGRLLAAAKDGKLRRTRRPILRVEGVVDSQGEVVVPRGMLMGAAAFSYGTELCQREIHAAGTSHGAAVAATLGRVVGRILFRGDPDGLLKGEPLGLRVDGRPDGLGPDAHRSLLLISTLRRRLVLGKTPFFGEYTEDQLQYLETDAPARGLARAIGSMFVGRPDRAGEGWRSGAGHVVDLTMGRSMIIDGEIFRPIDGRVRVSADPVVEFVAP